MAFTPPPAPPPPEPPGDPGEGDANIFTAWADWGGTDRAGTPLSSQAQSDYAILKNFYDANIEDIGIGYGTLVGTGRGGYISGSETGTKGMYNGVVRPDGKRDIDCYHVMRYGQNLMRVYLRMLFRVPDPWLLFAMARWQEAIQDNYRVGWRNVGSTLPSNVVASPYRCAVNYWNQAERTGTDYQWLQEVKAWELIERSIYTFGFNVQLTPPAGMQHHYGGALPEDFLQQIRQGWIDLLENHIVPKWYGTRTWNTWQNWKGYEQLDGSGFVRAMKIGEPIVMRSVSHTLFSGVMACYYRYLNTRDERWLASAKMLYDHWHSISIKPVNTVYGLGYAIKRGNTSVSDYAMPTVYLPTVFGLLAECREIGFYPEKITDDLLIGINRVLTQYWITGTDSTTTGRGTTGNSAILDANGNTIQPAPLEYSNGREIYPGKAHKELLYDEYSALLPWDEPGVITAKLDAATSQVNLSRLIFYPAARLAQAASKGTGGGSPPPPPPPAEKLAVSSNGRFLLDAQGQPLFLLADTAWHAYEFTTSEMDTYVADRAAKGFNTILGPVMWGAGRAEPGGYVNATPAMSDNAYYQHIDTFVQKVTAAGLYLVLVPQWAGDLGGYASDQQAYDYGAWLANRYAAYPNVLFFATGEYASEGGLNYVARIKKVGEGLASVGAHLVSVHPAGGDGYTKQSSSDYFHAESWLDFNSIQTWTTDSSAYNKVTDDWAESPTKPTFLSETKYEGEGADALRMRRNLWHGLCSGSLGYGYGAYKVWRADSGWETNLALPGASQMRHAKDLIESLANPLARVPDQSIIVSSNPSTDYTVYKTAMRDSGGSWFFVYLPAGGSVTVNLAKITASASADAYWLNPRTGARTFADSGPTSATAVPFTAPDTQDWVLWVEGA